MVLKNINEYIRAQVFKRDGFKCVYCSKSHNETKLEIDHIRPLWDGGSDDINNLATCCRKCNSNNKGYKHGKPTIDKYKVYEYVVNYIKEHAFSPTVREICLNFGWTGTRSALDKLKSLEFEGYIRRIPKYKRNIIIMDKTPKERKSINLKKEKLIQNQMITLQYIKNFIDEEGYTPELDKIATALNISLGSASRYVKWLKENFLLEQKLDSMRSMRLSEKAKKLLEIVRQK